MTGTVDHATEPTQRELAAGSELLRRAFVEDLGGPDGVDLTEPVLAGRHARAELVARADGTVCGLALVRAAFAMRDVSAVSLAVLDGAAVTSGTVLAQIEGPASGVLCAERTALNVVQRLSGVATLTRQFVDAIDGCAAHIFDTRKTIPGMRALQRWAVRCGGGRNHRFGLFDEAMLKDNHIAVAGGIEPAVRQLRLSHPACRLHVETTTIAQVAEAVGAGADVIMLDNMGVDEMARAVELVAGRAETEASGGITLATVRKVADTGVDRISVGAITHSAPALDLALDVRAT